MRKNGDVMTEDMIEDMTLGEGETEEYVQAFLRNLARREEVFQKKK